MPSSAPAVQLEKVTALPSRPFLARPRRNLIFCLAIVLLALALYNPAVHNSFTNMDDEVYITRNPHVRAGLTWATVKWAFTPLYAGPWHPLTWLSHALDYQLFKLNPAGHHYVSILIHATSAFLLFLLLEGATGLAWPSFVVAALFAVHPVNVESVAWVSERKNVLSMSFFLLAMLAYQRYVRQISVKRYLVVALLFALGLMAKPEIITLPLVLLLWDYWPLQRMRGAVASDGPRIAVAAQSFWSLLAEKVPLLLLSAGSAVITLVAQQQAIRPIPIGVRAGNAIVAYARYLGMAFWPARLAAFYPHSGRLRPAWQIAGAVLLLAAITALVVRLRHHRYLLIGWLWFLGTLVPVIGVVQVGVQSMADRYAYIPFIGLSICVVWGAHEIAQETKAARGWAIAPAALVLLACGLVTHRQIGYWRDSETLWRHTLSITEDNPFAHSALGDALAQQGRVDEAIAQFDAAERLNAYSPLEMASMAAYKRNHGYLREAIEEFRNALKAADDATTRALVLSQLSSAYLQVGEIERAKMACDAAIQQNPNNGSAHSACGLVAARKGDWASAIEQISLAMKLQPADVGYLLLARLELQSGRPADAERDTQNAQRISQDFSQTQRLADLLLEEAGIKPKVTDIHP